MQARQVLSVVPGQIKHSINEKEGELKACADARVATGMHRTPVTSSASNGMLPLN